MEIAQQVSLIKNRAMAGREIDVLVESSSTPREGYDTGFVVGRSYRDAPEVDGLVLLEGDFAPGDFVRAKVTQALAYDLVAVPVAAVVAAAAAPSGRSPRRVAAGRQTCPFSLPLRCDLR